MRTMHTDRLLIRNFRPADWGDLHGIIVQYQASEYAQYDHEWPTSEEEIQAIARWFSEGDSYLAVCLPGTGKLIGFVALNREEREDGLTFLKRVETSAGTRSVFCVGKAGEKNRREPAGLSSKGQR
jgi:RimJ/RimL family protein N-acetyltransferase